MLGDLVFQQKDYIYRDPQIPIMPKIPKEKRLNFPSLLKQYFLFKSFGFGVWGHTHHQCFSGFLQLILFLFQQRLQDPRNRRRCYSGMDASYSHLSAFGSHLMIPSCRAMASIWLTYSRVQLNCSAIQAKFISGLAMR